MQRPNRSIQLQTWTLRLFYFFSGGGPGFLVPFITLFYRSRNLSGTQIGWIGTVTAVSGMLAAPLWMRLSGQGDRRRKALMWMHLAGLALIGVVSQMTLFIWLAVMMGVFEIAVVGIQPASDTMTVKILEGSQRGGFGSVRVWASLGWAVMAIGGGILIQRTSYLAGFIAYMVTLVLSIVLLFGIRAEKTQPEPAPKQSISIWKRLFSSFAPLKSPVFLGLTLALVIQWAAQVGVQTFEPVFLKQLNATDTVIGLAGAMSAIVELGGMFLADRLSRRLGAGRIIAIGFLVYAAGAGLVLAAPSVPAILAERAINGIAFSFFTVGVVNYINQNTKPGETATLMALITITVRSLVTILASPLSGRAFDTLGVYWLYAIALGGYILAYAIFRLTLRRKPTTPAAAQDA